MKALILSVCLLSSSALSAQTPESTKAAPPAYANYGIMLVNPAPGGGGLVVMHTPQNGLELVDAAKMQAALSSGYVPVRAAELTDLIAGFKAEVTRLSAENARLQGKPTNVIVTQAPTLLTPEEQEARRQEQAASEQMARRQQLIQGFLMLQNLNRPQTMNLDVNVRDCTHYPALCVGR